MSPLEKIFMQHIIFEYLDVIGLLVAFVGILIAIQTKKKVCLAYSIYTRPIIGENSLKDFAINGHSYTRLSLSIIILRNEGNSPIYKKNILENSLNLKTRCANHEDILIVTYNQRNNALEHSNVVLERYKNDVSITIERFFPGDEVVLEFYHTGWSNNNLYIDGNIEGQKKIRRREYVEFSSPTILPIGVLNYSQSFYWAICISFIFYVFNGHRYMNNFLLGHNFSCLPFYYILIFVFIFVFLVCLFVFTIYKWLNFNRKV